MSQENKTMSKEEKIKIFNNMLEKKTSFSSFVFASLKRAQKNNLPRSCEPRLKIKNYDKHIQQLSTIILQQFLTKQAFSLPNLKSSEAHDIKVQLTKIPIVVSDFNFLLFLHKHNTQLTQAELNNALRKQLQRDLFNNTFETKNIETLITMGANPIQCFNNISKNLLDNTGFLDFLKKYATNGQALNDFVSLCIKHNPSAIIGAHQHGINFKKISESNKKKINKDILLYYMSKHSIGNYSCKQGDLKSITFLLKNFDLSPCVDHERYSTIFCTYDSYPQSEETVNLYCDLLKTYYKEEGVLDDFLYAAAKHNELIDKALELGIDFTEAYKSSLLVDVMRYAKHFPTSIVQKLIKNGACVDKRDHNQRTIFYYCAQLLENNYENCIDFLKNYKDLPLARADILFYFLNKHYCNSIDLEKHLQLLDKVHTIFSFTAKDMLNEKYYEDGFSLLKKIIIDAPLPLKERYMNILSELNIPIASTKYNNKESIFYNLCYQQYPKNKELLLDTHFLDCCATYIKNNSEEENKKTAYKDLFLACVKHNNTQAIDHLKDKHKINFSDFTPEALENIFHRHYELHDSDNNFEIITYCIQNGANLSTVNKDGKSLFYYVRAWNKTTQALFIQLALLYKKNKNVIHDFVVSRYRNHPCDRCDIESIEQAHDMGLFSSTIGQNALDNAVRTIFSQEFKNRSQEETLKFLKKISVTQTEYIRHLYSNNKFDLLTSEFIPSKEYILFIKNNIFLTKEYLYKILLIHKAYNKNKQNKLPKPIFFKIISDNFICACVFNEMKGKKYEPHLCFHEKRHAGLETIELLNPQKPCTDLRNLLSK